jgi:hydroxymethylpyrimidine kinase/phosphomethylpyrimidine kinase/thiamine-phosphate diphosphorylase
LSSAICAAVALDYNLPDAIVLAKTYVQAGLKAAIGIGKGNGSIAHTGFPSDPADFPWISQKPDERRPGFPANRQSLDLYPLVNNLEDLKLCIDHGFNTVQLRIKNMEVDILKKIILEAVTMAKNTDTQLYINDHWQLAIEARAYGVHLGQEDLLTADINAIRDAGLRLGLSSNGLYSLASAYAFNPSYIAAGPIYATNSKPDAKPPLGIEKLKVMASLSPKPLCAIGGINKCEFDKIKNYGCDGVAFIGALTRTTNQFSESIGIESF